MITRMQKHLSFFCAAVSALLLTACGGAPATPFNTPTPIPTYEFVAPTLDPVLATAAAQRESSGADTVAIERGRDRYVALDCGECHGENGEGGDAPALNEMTMDEDTFITFMRSGGELGTEHQYSTDRLSASGGRNLYAYLISLHDGE